ncbi:MupA/Atu3671 family FMN-dependent luciferase-like monooxygenase [Kitasatospora phosalacinea]|uniref:MupA/Atu3671 family FMN-dependent luciferase-like monooxygenase n=1 Tax=Kitasatospora phosalacinea TaxID=2065 RepID=A0ABW6GWL3_9ACTN
MEFGLFYFADYGSAGGDRYRLLLESVKFADRHGFSSVWTPERHFHEFGGQYPNPAVVGAALAAVTERISIRAGSVVAPLHHPMRIAEDWSVVDNLSRGRAGVSLASGWHAVDFVLQPDNYRARKELLVEAVETVRRLWAREEVVFRDGAGQESAVRMFPPPVQAELPIWLTSAGSADTFRTAGRLGTGVLTHLIGQDLPELARNVAAYREELAAAHGPDARGHVSLMLHTLLGDDREKVREEVREPFGDYLRSSIGLIMKTAAAAMPGIDLERLSAEDREFLVARSFDRYFDTGGLFGTVDDGVETVRRLRGAGVDEIACLIDFGVPEDRVLDGLHHLDALRVRCSDDTLEESA